MYLERKVDIKVASFLLTISNVLMNHESNLNDHVYVLNLTFLDNFL